MGNTHWNMVMICGLLCITVTVVAALPGQKINWESISAALPVGQDAASKASRKKLFRKFDANGNGVVSLAEADYGIHQFLSGITDAKRAIAQAFTVARNSVASKRGKTGDEYVELREFRLFLLSLRQYFEYHVAFSRVDANGDGRIDVQEFTDAQAMLKIWVGDIEPDEEFEKVDLNGGGMILFNEFCVWATEKNLDVEDDDDFEMKL